MYCMKCGALNPDGCRFCMKCGTPLAAAVPPVQVAPAAVSPAKPAHAPESPEVQAAADRLLSRSSLDKTLGALAVAGLALSILSAVFLQTPAHQFFAALFACPPFCGVIEFAFFPKLFWSTQVKAKRRFSSDPLRLFRRNLLMKRLMIAAAFFWGVLFLALAVARYQFPGFLPNLPL